MLPKKFQNRQNHRNFVIDPGFQFWRLPDSRNDGNVFPEASL
jgi:hypothetical protein